MPVRARKRSADTSSGGVIPVPATGPSMPSAGKRRWTIARSSSLTNTNDAGRAKNRSHSENVSGHSSCASGARIARSSTMGTPKYVVAYR